MAAELLKVLKGIEVLKGVPDAQLQWILDKGETKHYKNGAHVFKKNDPIDKMFIILKGSLSIKMEQNGNFKEVNQIPTKGITGALPFSRATKATGIGVGGRRYAGNRIGKAFF